MGEAFNALLAKYPNLQFIDTPYWSGDDLLSSTQLVIDLLPNAYFIEGDLYIENPQIIRPYEYRSSYCGTPDSVENDWYFGVDRTHLIKQLAFGDSKRCHNKPYRYIGISYWTQKDTQQLKQDLLAVPRDSGAASGILNRLYLIRTPIYIIYFSDQLRSRRLLK